MTTKDKKNGSDVGNGATDALALDVNEFQEVQLQRKWYVAQPMGCPIVGCVLLRSENVRELYPSEYEQQNDPLYAYAIELRQPIPKESRSLMMGDEPAEGKIGEVVYMFEPKLLQGTMLKALALGVPFMACPQEKRTIKSKRHKKSVQAWQWKARLFPRPVTPVTNPRELLMPSINDAAHLLPKTAGEGEVIDTTGEEVNAHIG